MKNKKQLPEEEQKNQNTGSGDSTANEPEITVFNATSSSTYFEERTDGNGTSYLYTSYPLVSRCDMISHAGDQPKVPSIFNGLPIDTNTLSWTEDGELTVTGGFSGGGGTGLDENAMWNVLGAAGDQQIDKSHVSNALSNYLPVNGGDVDGTINFTNDSGGIQGTMGANDYYRIIGRSSATDAGYMEIATADNGNEPIHVRQYTGKFGNIARSLTLLDEGGSTRLPGYLYAKYIHSDTPNDENPVIDQIVVTNGLDKFYRKANLRSLRSALNFNQQTLDLSGLDENTWYPCTITVSPWGGTPTRITIFNGLRGDKPSWSWHSSGFSLLLDYTVNGSGWGTIPVIRNFYNYTFAFCLQSPVGGITQNAYASTEVIWLRGGGIYYYITSNGLNLTVHKDGYNWTHPSGSYNAPTRNGSQLTDPMLQATSVMGVANRLLTPHTIWGQTFDGTGNVDGPLNITPTDNNYNEGIRINAPAGKWATILMGGTGSSGTNENAWGIFRNNNNDFVISRNSSDGLNGLVIKHSGNIGIGTTSPSSRLHVAGNILATGGITAKALSDHRLKINFREIDANSILMSLGLIRSFDYNDKAKEFNPDTPESAIGLVYHQAIKVLPGMSARQQGDKYGSLNYLNTDYINLIGAATQQNHIRLNEVEEQLRLAQQRIEKLESKLSNTKN